MRPSSPMARPAPARTFTVTGGPERYADRGLIPRSIAFLFHSIAQRRTSLHKV